MTCTLIAAQLDDYLAGELSRDRALELDRHTSDCASCQQLVDQQRSLQTKLKDYGELTVPAPGNAFFDRALARAAQHGVRRQRNRWVMSGFGGAMAAGLAIWMIGGMLIKTPEIADPVVPGITMALEEPRTLNLAFSSAVALADATMTIMLPPGIELEGFQGQREITWMTSLTKGKNVLPLTLIATSPQGGELLATLQHQDDDRSFRVQVTVI